uniref:Putative secreted protein n=1 Tax=Anopheles marajoara TaxID=58244 RepID=A0A2M4CBB9_9DIPT
MHSVLLHSVGLMKQPFIVTFISLVKLFVVQTAKHPDGRSCSDSSQMSIPSLHSPSLHWYDTHRICGSAIRARLNDPWMIISTG